MKLSDYVDPLAHDIAFWLMGVKDPGYPLDALGDLSMELCEKLRAMAAVVFLSEGDTDTFLHNLMRSATVREIYLRRCVGEGRLDDYHRASGRCQALLDGIAAGDLDLARRIVDLSPAAWRSECEYEDDYCYAQILHRWVLGAAHDVEILPLLEQFDTAVSGADPRLDVCRSLTLRDQASFDGAFDSLLERREADIEDAKARGQLEEPHVIAHRLVFVEGLALLRLADARGLVTRLDYPMCPSLARAPMTTPFEGL